MTKYAVFNSNGTVERILEVSEALANPPPNFVEIPLTITSTNEVTTDYYPMYSTYEIFRADNTTHDLEQDLVAIENNISALQTGKSNTNHGHTADDITDSATKKIMTADERTKLNNIEDGANNYTHPSYTAKTAGLYKVTVDGTGHVSGATAVTKADITGLGIPSTNTT